ncbi:hypothetical protein OAP51_04290 [Alphaproteobacteria bacterium]|nr:hypothetical protein [Alphaproteobacteria bacterium]
MNPHKNSQSALVGDWSRFKKKSLSRLSKNTILHEYKIMRLFRVITFILLIGLTVSSQSSAELVAEESVDEKWVVNFITENSVHATVNGQVTHGDGLHVRLVKGHCDKGNLLTFVYTYSNHPKIEQLKGSYVTTKFNGGEVIVKVVYASPFLMGHRATIDMGWGGIDELKEILSGENPLVIEYVVSDEVKITDYFDILQNSWSNDGVSDALDRAAEICGKL